ncbi:MAG: hypothetical protein COT74_00905 [Bdellovibrionales bacterium CG10_big_fil_rev_8_21_14_0_10_45_34]|nr:MAG: hypothetical protein COT74_00905 [Bdellovibrionales bacterium CG10_big_fil_rev_8_21_14_0_10_45_34]
MTFRNPEYFWLFIPLAVVLGLLMYRRKQIKTSVMWPNAGLFLKGPRGFKARFWWLARLMWLAGASFLIVGLARPQVSSVTTKKNVEGIDIVFALDISDSMLIEDMNPYENRLEAAKSTIRDFIEKRFSDRMGLVVFSGEAYTRVPPTLDYKVLKQSVFEVQTQRALKLGTAIGVALANAVARLRDSEAKTRVIVLLTDGENNSGTISPETALEIAKGYSMRIYTIGVGRDGEARLPVYHERGGQRFKTYQPMHSKVNDDLLGRMAEETGGKYFRATTAGGLEEVFDSINSLEKTKIESNQFTQYEEKFAGWIILSLLLGSLGFVTSATWLRGVGDV